MLFLRQTSTLRRVRVRPRRVQERERRSQVLLKYTHSHTRPLPHSETGLRARGSARREGVNKWRQSSKNSDDELEEALGNPNG